MIGTERTREHSAALLLALAIDLLSGDPPSRWHPVAWLGQWIGRLERAAPRRGAPARLAAGAGITAVVVAGSAGLGLGVEGLLRRAPAMLRVTALGLLLKPALSVRGLIQAAQLVETALERADLDTARHELRALVSRPASGLTGQQIASATIESLAENLPDSVLAPALAFLIGGLGGAYGYRAANTLDAMIGYHGDHEELGKVAARLDDLFNLAPARIAALLLAASALVTGDDARAALTTMCVDAGRTESPNAGWPMSAAAGALGVRLEKPGHYCLGGDYRQPAAADIARARRLLWTSVALGAAVVNLALLWRPGSTKKLGRRS
jgi:adenosylcobinamide-phosphate synthase